MKPTLDDREKISHLLRRFGFGATPEEIDSYLKLGVDGAIESLLNFEKVDEGFPISPWEFCFEEGKDEVYLDPFRVVGWWGLRMVLTKRPLQEKLTLFWHDHFAVSATKVELGPSMLGYLEAIRKNCSGKFETILMAMARDPAMMQWLDTISNEKGRPNENFGRELLELFTLGIGNYSEQDIKEASRAFTGWGIRYLLFEQGGEKVQEVAKDCIKTGRPMLSYCYSDDLHDHGTKTVMGQTKNWTGEQVVEMLAARPETARYLAKKLWSFFAYPDPAPAIVERLAKAYQDSGQRIKDVLRAMTKTPEFWSERCVRQRVKSPIEYTVSIVRQLGVSQFLALLHGPNPSPMKPIAQPLREAAGGVTGLAFQQGMLLLYPPDVDGWEWGSAWITTDSMTKRIQMADLLMLGGAPKQDFGLANAVTLRLKAHGSVASSQEIASSLATVFDAKLTAEQLTIMAQACDRAGGPGSLNSPEATAKMYASMFRLLFGCPEFQYC